MIGTPSNVPTVISKEMLPNSVTLQASIIPNVGFSGSSNTITLTISDASFLPSSGISYTISGVGCSSPAISSASNSLTFSSCSVGALTAYAMVSLSSGANSYLAGKGF